jgi:hypothetical protein
VGGAGTAGRLLAGAFIAGAMGFAVSSQAGAAAGSAEDPQGDGGASIDIRQLTHADTATEIIYTVEAFTDFPADTPNVIDWALKLSGDSFDDATAFVDLGNLASLSGGFRCGLAGTVVPGTVTLKPTGTASSTAANSVELRYSRAELANCGAGDSYAYIVSSDNEDEAAVTDDEVPDSFDGGTGIAHTLTAIPANTTSTTAASTTTTTRAFRDRDCSEFRTQPQAQRFFEANNPTRDPHRLDEDGDGIACEHLAGGRARAGTAADPEIAATGTETPIRVLLGFIFLDAGCLAICLAGYRRSVTGRLSGPG